MLQDASHDDTDDDVSNDRNIKWDRKDKRYEYDRQSNWILHYHLILFGKKCPCKKQKKLYDPKENIQHEYQRRIISYHLLV